ncbi:exodeoxyribonuclease VII small subunit [Actinophytocola xanthii]|uniref:exodeoxyribonuclease VII small subunit n=1 Tax=Actinophytocola xanthii TaxID=1912961 RepID=UPI000ABB6BCF
MTDDLNYEQARDELAEVVARLETGGLSLEDSLALWERGEALAKICDQHLAGARERIESALAAAESEGSAAAEGSGVSAR